MNDDSLQPITSDKETTPTGCHTLLLATVMATDGSLIVQLADASGTVLPDRYSFLTGSYTQVAVTVRFPSLGGSLTVAPGTTSASTYTDSDGDCSITFYRASPDEFDVDFSMPTPKPTTLRPKPVVPTKRVRLLPKIGYPPPDSGEE